MSDGQSYSTPTHQRPSLSYTDTMLMLGENKTTSLNTAWSPQDGSGSNLIDPVIYAELPGGDSYEDYVDGDFVTYENRSYLKFNESIMWNESAPYYDYENDEPHCEGDPLSEEFR